MIKSLRVGSNGEDARLKDGRLDPRPNATLRVVGSGDHGFRQAGVDASHIWPVASAERRGTSDRADCCGVIIAPSA